MSKSMTIRIVVVLTLLPMSVSQALPSDNFDDNLMDASLWNLYEPNSYEWLDETNGRLEMRSTTSADEKGAYYVAKEWGFSVTENFSFRTDFHYSLISGPLDSSATVTLGLGKDWSNYLIIEAECYTDEFGDVHQEFYYELNIADYEVDSDKKARTINDGTLYISYDASKDELYLSDVGYWSSDAWITIPGLLQGTWGGDDVRPFLGGCSRGLALDSGDAYLDNFIVDPVGAIIAVDFDIGSDTLSLQSNAKWITSYVRFPIGYNLASVVPGNLADIIPGSIILDVDGNGVVTPKKTRFHKAKQMLIVRFEQSDVQNFLDVGEAELTISGELTDGTEFGGTDTVNVVMK